MFLGELLIVLGCTGVTLAIFRVIRWLVETERKAEEVRWMTHSSAQEHVQVLKKRIKRTQSVESYYFQLGELNGYKAALEEIES